jgi:acyl-coenzyme A synthetase/AMP-(fatty) acid ligase
MEDVREEPMSEPALYNAALDLADRHLAEGRGSKIAYIDDDRQLTFAELVAARARPQTFSKTWGSPASPVCAF